MNLNRIEDKEITLDLGAAFGLIMKKLHYILAVTALFAIFANVCTHLFVTPQYEAVSTFMVNNSSIGESTMITQSDLNASTQLVDTYSVILSSNTILEEVIAEAGVSMTPKQLRDKMSTVSVNNTMILQVSVLHEDPFVAAKIVNVIYDLAPDLAANIVDGSSLDRLDSALVPTEIASPSYTKMTVLGALLGMLLSGFVIVLRGLMDTTIKRQSDFERWNLPVLGTVPDFAEAKKNKYNYGYAKK